MKYAIALFIFLFPPFLPAQSIPLGMLSDDGKHLDLSKQKLKAIPEWVFNQQGIESLDLSGNKIIDISGNWRNLKDLKQLDLSKNPIKDISPIASCENLEELKLYFTNIRELPIEVLSLINLKKIDVRKTYIPVEQKQRLKEHKEIEVLVSPGCNCNM